MATLIFDLETVRDASLGWTPPDDKPDAFPPPYVHEVVCCGALWLDDYDSPRRLECLPGGEADILAAFATTAARRPTLVSWNGRGFDVPVIVSRSLRYGIAQVSLFGRDVRYRYTEDGHCDVADQLSDYGAAARPPLDGIARLIGLPGKQGTDGGMVADMIAAGHIDDVRRYCLRDVVQTAFCWYRWRLVRHGNLAGYRRAVAALLEYLDADPRFVDLTSAIDRGRLLLAGAESVAA